MKSMKLIFMMAMAGMIMVSCSQNGQKQSAENTKDAGDKIEIAAIDVDPSQSKIFWKGEMLGIYSHTGTLKMTSADIKIEEGNITGGNFTADMKSMVPTDDNYNPEEGSTKEKLVGHLSSADFFDVENHPTALFVITSVEGNTAKGNLTIRGNTHEEVVKNIDIKKDGENVIIKGDLVFDRKKYDVSWDSPIQDRVLSNDIEVKIELIGS